MRILIVSAYYWPEIAGNAPYVADVAEHLARSHEVTVLTGFPHYPAWRRDVAFRLVAREQRRGVTIRRRWHAVPAANKAGKAMSRGVYELSLLVGGLGMLTRGPRPDVVIGFCPSLADTLIAATAATFARRPLGLVFQDIVSLAAVQTGMTGGGPARVARAVERSVARRARAIGFVAEGFRSHLEGLGVGENKLVPLRNWARLSPSKSDRIETRRRFGWAPGDFVCLHAGNMGQKQGLDNLVAAARASEPGIRFVLAGDGGDRERIQALATGVQNVSFVGPQPPGVYEDMLASADVLLVNQRESVTDMALASKLTSYFAAGRPVVAAVAAASETAMELERASAGLVTEPGEPEELAGAVAKLRSDPALALRLGANGRLFADRVLGRPEALRAYEAFVDQLRERWELRAAVS